MTDEESYFEKVQRKLIAARIAFMSQLATVRADDLLKPAGTNAWSPLQITQHLCVVDEVVLEQMRRVQQEDNPFIESISEQVPPLTITAEPPVALATMLTRMQTWRMQLFSYLASVPTEHWQRPLRHQQWGQFTFYQFAASLALHDQQHTRQFLAINNSTRSTSTASEDV